MGVLGQYGAVLVGTWWHWVSVTWYCLVLSWTGLVQRLYACIYWKSGDWSDVSIAGRTDEHGRLIWAIQTNTKMKVTMFTCGACQLQSHPSRSSQSNVVLSSSKWRVCCILRLKTQRSSFKAPLNLGGGYVSSSSHALASLTSVMMGELLALLDRSISLHWLSNRAGP